MRDREKTMFEKLVPSPWEAHPPLVHFPVVFLLAGVGVDLFAWWRWRRQAAPPETGSGPLALTQLATGLLIAGVLGGVLAALTGFVAYVTAPLYAANALILLNWHLGLALASLTLFAWVAFVRWLDWASGPSVLTRATGLVAVVLLVAGAALGGHLVYRAGAGFDPGLFGPAAGKSAGEGGPGSDSRSGAPGGAEETPR